MDSRQQCFYCSKTFSYIGTYITHLGRDHNKENVYVSAEKLPDDGFVTTHDSILLQFIHEPHRDPFLHPSDNDSCDTEADRENACIDPEQPPVWTRMNGTPHLDNRLGWKPIINKYFAIFDNEIETWSLCSCVEEYWLAYWCVKHNSSRAAINKLIRNLTMATFSNFTWSHTVLKRVNEMSYAMGVALGNPAKCVTIVWPIETTFVMMITHISSSAILLNALNSSFHSLRSGNICRMLQQRNSMMLRKVSTQRWNQATVGEMNRYVGWISS